LGEISIGADPMRSQKLSQESMILALSFLCSFSGYIKDFYKHQDENGQRVDEVDLLGRSGSRGYSSGPHLHCVISQNQGMKLLSILFAFHDPATGEDVVPKEGMRLTEKK
jgi:hypothetical protein